MVQQLGLIVDVLHEAFDSAELVQSDVVVLLLVRNPQILSFHLFNFNEDLQINLKRELELVVLAV